MHANGGASGWRRSMPSCAAILSTPRPAARYCAAYSSPRPYEWAISCNARPLRRLVQSAIGDQLAKGLLSGAITDGDTVLVDLDAGADALVVVSGKPPAIVPGLDGSSSSSRS